MGDEKTEEKNAQIAETLHSETKKWLLRLQTEMKNITRSRGKTAGKSRSSRNKEVQEAIRNIRAYIKDSQHFADTGDPVRAFEAIVYAWGIYETLLNLGLVRK